MFTITRTANRDTLVTNPARPQDQLLLEDLADVLRLRAVLDTLLADQLDQNTDATLHHDGAQSPTVISSVTAQAIAHERNIRLSSSALRMAINRNAIPGAHKRGGRWFMPEDAFLIWLAAFNPRS